MHTHAQKNTYRHTKIKTHKNTYRANIHEHKERHIRHKYSDKRNNGIKTQTKDMH